MLTLAELITRYDRPGPRYTGYPMPPAWQDDFP
jgi:oxygen-independent coproporphyrinogen-3 oxidase